jgi:hypothetical protein
MDDAFEEPVDEIEEDFAPVDLTVAITRLLVRGESRDEVARLLRISRADVDARIAEATALTEAEALNEREWIVRERLLDLTRQASAVDLPSFETSRLKLLLELSSLELGLIAWARRKHGGA